MKTQEKEMTFLEHLEELRWHLVRAVIVVVLGMGFCFFNIKWIFDEIIFAPAQPDFATFRWMCEFGIYLSQFADIFSGLCIDEVPILLQSRQVMGQFQMALGASFALGIIIGFPYVAWEAWRFIKPGLHAKEKRYSRGAVGAMSLLFFSGVLFGYYIISPISFYFFATFKISDMVTNEFDITSFVSTIATIVLGSGVLFQLPVVIYFLSKVGILTPAILKRYRRHAIVVVLIVAAIITPPDVFSQILISMPLFVLYELGILVSKRVEKKRAKQEAEAGW